MRNDVVLSAFICVFAAAISHATTRVDSRGVGVTEDPALSIYCEISAKFLGETHFTDEFEYRGKRYAETKVRWSFEIQSKKPIGVAAQCPTGNNFELSVRGAEFAAFDGTNGTYVYPPHITPAAKNQTVQLRARIVHVKDSRSQKEFDEWLVTDWEDGYKIVAE